MSLCLCICGYIHFTQKWYQKWHISAYQAHDHEQPFSHSTGPVPFVGKKENERRDGLRPSRNEMVLGMDEWMDGSYITDLNLIRRVFVESQKFWEISKVAHRWFSFVKRYGFQVQHVLPLFSPPEGEVWNRFPGRTLVQDAYHMLSPVVRPLENSEVEIDALGICFIISHESSVFYNSCRKYPEITVYIMARLGAHGKGIGNENCVVASCAVYF